MTFKTASRRERITRSALAVARRVHCYAEFAATCIVVASLSPLIVSLHAAKFLHDRFFAPRGDDASDYVTPASPLPQPAEAPTLMPKA
jgi:hypothetical protein